MALPALPQFKINGPFWNAEADLLRLASPARAWDLRELFVDLGSRDYTKSKVLLPGTMIVLAFVRKVRITPAASATPSYGFVRPSTDTPPAETIGIADIKQHVLSGKISLLLVQADPAQWKGEDPTRLGTVTCLAGHVSLDVLTLLGKARLPWQEERVGAPFQLARIVPDPTPHIGQPQRGYRLTIETDRLTPDEQVTIAAAWARFASSVDSGNPANATAGAGASAPRWTTLSVANPTGIPQMYWLALPWNSGTPKPLPLHIERGELALVLADESPYDKDPPATTLARTVLDDVIIARTTSGTTAEVTVQVNAQRFGVARPLAGKLVYLAAPGTGGWDEKFALSGLDVAFDPAETPRAVREAPEQPAPSWKSGLGAVPVEPPVLWAFSPLADGWAQLPIPNLTEQMYLDARLAREPVPASALFTGAVAYGNDGPKVLASVPKEQGWTLALLDADMVAGIWTLRQASPSDPLVLTKIELTLSGPEVVLNGLLWLATGRPTPEDALPALDDWVAGLRSMALRTIDPTVDMLPPLVKVSIASLSFTLRASTPFPSAQLGEWSATLDVDAGLFKSMVELGLLADDAFGRNRPLVWRRHQTLPMVQALPMTQSRSPAAFPSASRQLAPFELSVAVDPATGLTVPSGWTLGYTGGGIAAEFWPRALGSMVPAREWAALADLPLVSLSLPGLVLDPRARGRTGLPDDASTALPQQWRHDLPYADEGHALAQLPKIPSPAATTPAATAAVPEPVRSLSRETFAEHWQRLSERASLAAADAVAATGSASGATQVLGIVEPLRWPVVATVEASSYPGTLSFADASTTKGIELSGDEALKGVTGAFDEGSAPGTLSLHDPPAPGIYPVIAGSMAAVRAADGSLRDQRGLLRGPTAGTTRVLRTPIRLADAPETPYELTTLLEAVALRPGPAGAAGDPWRLWFRDLPVAGGSFTRPSTRSPRAEDVNDPEAVSRGFDHLNGFEWRLEPAATGRYELFGLHFYPLTLEAVTLAGDDVTHVELIGRLQLPVAGGGEIDDLANAVRLTFDLCDGSLALAEVQAESALCDWPLALASGEAGDAPRIEWTKVALGGAGDGVTIDGAALVFQLLGAAWRIPLEPISFTVAATAVEARYCAIDALASEPMPPREVHLSLDAASGVHGVTVVLGLRIGRGILAMPAGARAKPLTWRTAGEPPELVPAGARTAFAAEIGYDLVSGGVSWTKGLLFGDVDLERVDPSGEPTLIAGPGALQLRWRTYTVANPRLQLLAGMHLDTEGAAETPGFATAAFRVFTAANDVPTFHLTSSFVEAVVLCRWGEFLQEVQGTGAPPSPKRVFASSAGNLVFGFTGESREIVWDEQYLLNGFLEVKDLVSWPSNAAFDAAKVQLTLPTAKPAVSLDHLRHTIRILFDQHAIPAGTLDTGPADLLFQLGAGKGWQFLAVVEHQLIDVSFDATLGTLGLNVDRRWVAVQEVRLVTPASFKVWLLAFKNDAVKVQAPASSAGLATVPIGDATYGELGSGVRAQLAEGTAPALDALQAGTLVVEASAVHWLKELPVTAPAATALQYLPSGTQLAALSRPEDYGPTDPRDPAWLLLQMPFLGRLQDESRDAVDPPPAGSPAPPLLAIDPVLNLQRRRAGGAAIPPLVLALSSWADSAAVNAVFSAFDAAVGRTFSRLDPRALEESWFYVQLAAPEPPPPSLPSVLASLQDTPARLGRPASLGLVYSAQRKYYPPRQDPAGEVPWTDRTSDQPLWRPGSLFAIQAVSSLSPTNSPPYGWLATALQIMTGLLPRTAGQSGLHRFVAATEVPVALASAPVPAAVAVSPYLTLEFVPTSGETTLRLSVAELLCLDSVSGRLRPVATHVFETGATASEANVRAAAATWARETQVRLAPESPVAVLRFRDVRARPDAEGSTGLTTAPLVTSYSFALVAATSAAGALAQRVFRLRSHPLELRFRDGRFGGCEAPAFVQPFEVAPPQVNGVEPLYLTPPSPPETLPPSETPPPDTASVLAVRPWGLAGLRTTVQYTAGGAGVCGRASAEDGVALWWQSLRHAVVYRSALSGDPAAGLPPAFRAPPIRSLLPVLPDPPLPELDLGEELGLEGPAIARRQPVLPGSIRTTLVGARPGVFHSLRHQVVRQSGLHAEKASRGKALVSGSVPVRHRAPRPIPLPLNVEGKDNIALLPWASAFDPVVPLLVRSSPADEAFLAASDSEPAHRLQMKIVAPPRGEIDSGWSGTIVADIALESSTDGPPDPQVGDWMVDLVIQHRRRLVAYATCTLQVGGRFTFTVRSGDAGENALRELLLEMSPGEMLTVCALVGRKRGDESAAGFRQTLSFPFRLSDPRAVRLPLDPVFFLFEDPEYNRLLASAAKHATVLVKVQGPDGPNLSAVTLSTDRSIYNPDGQLALRYDWDGNAASARPKLSIDLLDSTGVPRPLQIDDGGSLTSEIALDAGELKQLSLVALFYNDERVTLAGGQSLLFKLAFAAGSGILEPATIYLSVDISSEPVTPVPQAAYALLRWQMVDGIEQVDCARFAWGPQATRIELVCPDDLQREIVRRRAVFLWTDTARSGLVTGYAIQKITRTGSTHFPMRSTIEVPDVPPASAKGLGPAKPLR